MQIDANKITEALRLWFQPGDVFEIRVLDAVTRAYFRPHIESGYFDYDHIDLVLLEQLKRISQYTAGFRVSGNVRITHDSGAENRLGK